MPEKGLVNVNRQTIHAIIPGLDYRTVKQINKSRLMTIIGFSIVIGVGFGGYGIAYLLVQYNIVTLVIVAIITLGIYLSSSAHLVQNGPKNGIKNFKAQNDLAKLERFDLRL